MIYVLINMCFATMERLSFESYSLCLELVQPQISNLTIFDFPRGAIRGMKQLLILLAACIRNQFVTVGIELKLLVEIL